MWSIGGNSLLNHSEGGVIGKSWSKSEEVEARSEGEVKDLFEKVGELEASEIKSNETGSSVNKCQKQDM